MKKVKLVLPLMIIGLMAINSNAQQRIGFVNINYVVDTLYYADSTQFIVQQAQQSNESELMKISQEAQVKDKEMKKISEDSINIAAKIVIAKKELADLEAEFQRGLGQQGKKVKNEEKVDLAKVNAQKTAKAEEVKQLEKSNYDASIKAAAIREEYVKLAEKYSMISSGAKESNQIIEEAVQKASLDFVSDCAAQVAKAKGYTQVMNGSASSLLVNLSPINSDITNDVVKVAIKDRKKFRELYSNYYAMMLRNYEQQKAYYQQMQQMQKGGGAMPGGN